MKKAVCLFSGGKDSVFSVFCAIFQGFEPVLLTFKSEEYSMMFHHPNIKWTKLQAEAMGLKHIIIETSSKNELADLEAKLQELKPDAIFSGAIGSEYQRQRIEQIGERLGIATYAPLWHKDKVLMEEMLANFEIYTVAVSAQDLGPEFLGKQFSEIVKKNLNIHPFLEGGEGETFVAYAPFFTKRIIIDEWEKQWDGVRGIAHIKKAHLE